MPKSRQSLDFGEIKSRAQQTISLLSARDQEFRKYEKMYTIEPEAEDGLLSRSGSHLLFDTHPHDAINSVVRLYTINDPLISVPSLPASDGLGEEELQQREAERRGADKTERFLRALLWAIQNRTFQNPVEQVLFQLALFDEATIAIDPLIATDPDAEVPFTLFVPHSASAYPAYSKRSGLLHHVLAAEMSLEELRLTYGEEATEFLSEDGGVDQIFNVMDYVDRSVRCIWVEEAADQPILLEEHGLPFVPRVSMIASGHQFFLREDLKRIPLLYGLLKAGVWAARNQNLSLMNDNILRYLSAPLVANLRNPQSFTFSANDRIIRLHTDERIGQLVRQVVPREQLELHGILSQMMESGSIPRVVQGQIPGSGQWAAAAIAALTSSGRLPTMQIAGAVNRMMSAALTIVLRWIKHRKDPVTILGPDSLIELNPSEIPDPPRVVFQVRPDQEMEKQITAGLVSTLFGMNLIGIDDALEMLERARIIDSAQATKENLIETAILKQELPAIAASVKGIGMKIANVQKELEATQGAPTAPALGTEQTSSPALDVLSQVLGAASGAGGMNEPGNPNTNSVPPF